MTLVLWGDRVAESASVGVHAASLIISQALLWAAWPQPSITGTRKTCEWRCLIRVIIPTLVKQHISSFCLKYKRGKSFTSWKKINHFLQLFSHCSILSTVCHLALHIHWCNNQEALLCEAGSWCLFQGSGKRQIPCDIKPRGKLSFSTMKYPGRNGSHIPCQ
jgi:hypothetical protein